MIGHSISIPLIFNCKSEFNKIQLNNAKKKISCSDWTGWSDRLKSCEQVYKFFFYSVFRFTFPAGFFFFVVWIWILLLSINFFQWNEKWKIKKSNIIVHGFHMFCSVKEYWVLYCIHPISIISYLFCMIWVISFFKTWKYCTFFLHKKKTSYTWFYVQDRWSQQY